MSDNQPKRKLLGVVGVDSGQLIITDPSYIDSTWHEEGDAEVTAIEFWGRDAEDLVKKIKELNPKPSSPGAYLIPVDSESDYETKLKKIRLIIIAEDYLVSTRYVKESTMSRRILEITTSEDQGGQLNYDLGHPGLAVAFRSGLGDGVYQVWATYGDHGEWGERIEKVEIILIEDKEEEK